MEYRKGDADGTNRNEKILVEGRKIKKKKGGRKYSDKEGRGTKLASIRPPFYQVRQV